MHQPACQLHSSSPNELAVHISLTVSPHPHACLQVTGKLSSTSTELGQVRKKAELADKLQTELQEAQEALIERDGELQDLHQDVDQVSYGLELLRGAQLLLCCSTSHGHDV